MESTTEENVKNECQMDEIVKQRLKCCEVTSKGLITGYVDSRGDYDNLIRDLKVFGYSFAVRSCSVGDPEKASLKFRSVSADLQIPFFGSPFHIEGTTYFLCAQGNKYYKTRDDKEKSGPEDDTEDGEKSCPRKKRRRAKETIKMGCPARMTVKCVRVYPDYKTMIDSWRRKSDVLQRLKGDLILDPPPRSEIRYWIALSPENAHTHKRNTTQKIQSLHPDLILEIHTLVMRGVTSVRVIKAHLRNVVERMFENSTLKPDPSNSAFYPSDKSVYNHSHEAKLLRVRMEAENQNQEETQTHRKKSRDDRASITVMEPPQRIVEPPERMVEPPQKVIEAPQRMVESPQRMIETPQRIIETPQRMLEPQQRMIEPPQRMIETPQRIIETPQRMIETPQRMVEPPQSAEPLPRPPTPAPTDPPPSTTPQPQQTIPMISTSFSGEWQDTQMLTPNLVQVNGDGTIVYVMAHPIDNAILSRVDGTVDGAIHDAANGLMSVKMDDNSYIVSVIPEGTTGRILNLNDGSGGVPTSDTLHMNNVITELDRSAMGNVRTVVELDILEPTDRTSDINRVITLEGNVVDSGEGNRRKESFSDDLQTSTVVGANLEGFPRIHADQLGTMTYNGTVITTSNEELSRKCREESIEEKEKREDILELIREQEFKLQKEVDSEEEVERFDKGQQTDDVEDQPEPIILSEEEQQQLQMLQQEQQQQQQQQQQKSEETSKERAFLSLRAALRDCAQDVINMSYSCANHAVLEEAYTMLLTCRQRMLSEQERRQKGGGASGESDKRDKSKHNPSTRVPIKTRRNGKTRRSVSEDTDVRKSFKPNIIRERKSVIDNKIMKTPEIPTDTTHWIEQKAENVANSYVLCRQEVMSSAITAQDKKQGSGENDSDEYDLVISEG